MREVIGTEEIDLIKKMYQNHPPKDITAYCQMFQHLKFDWRKVADKNGYLDHKVIADVLKDQPTDIRCDFLAQLIWGIVKGRYEQLLDHAFGQPVLH
ncbi:hypothetical protein [Brevibacillus formosus]|uniref:hypothetical protein n=1 Tax=Brevibacillus formosus TaxID=54913 RepID=UPI003F198410